MDRTRLVQGLARAAEGAAEKRVAVCLVVFADPDEDSGLASVMTPLDENVSVLAAMTAFVDLIQLQLGHTKGRSVIEKSKTVMGGIPEEEGFYAEGVDYSGIERYRENTNGQGGCGIPSDLPPHG